MLESEYARMGFTNEIAGKFRELSVHETLRRMTPKLPLFGITRIADITGLDNLGVPVFLCIRPNAKLLSVSQGKGLTAEAATVSAIMESVEQFHAENIVPDVEATAAKDLKHVIDLKSLAKGRLWKSEYYTDLPMDWVIGSDLVSGTKKLIPFSLLNFDTSRFRPGQNLFANTTTGLASGNTKNEALLHGLLEIIERDNTFRFRANRQNTLVKLESIDHPELQAMIQKIAETSRLEIWDITNVGQVPAFACILINKNKVRRILPVVGYGAHLCKHVALSRAITEACQTRLTFISGSRDDIYSNSYLQDVDEIERLFSHSMMAELDYAKISDIAIEGGADVALQEILRRLNEAGIDEVAYYDHTRQEFNVAVVHVVAPKLKVPLEEGWAYDE